MPRRREDIDIITWLRDIDRRLKFLQGGDKAVRRNDIRVGDIVIGTDSDTNSLIMTNLTTGDKSSLGVSNDIEFSYSGNLSISGTVSNNYSPPFVPRIAGTIVEVVIGLNEAVDDDVTIALHVNDDSYQTEFVLSAGTTTALHKVNIPVVANRRTFVEAVSIGSPSVKPKNLSVTLRFGVPEVEVSP